VMGGAHAPGSLKYWRKPNVMLRAIILVVALPALSESTQCPERCLANDGTEWPCRFYNSGTCMIPVIGNASRNASVDVNIVAIGPYSGTIGNMMTMAEPFLVAAAQEIEDSDFLPGYRLNIYLSDSKCTEQDGTRATIEALITAPPKHAILGDSCSQSCNVVNDAARLFNVLTVSPGCDSPGLSDRVRYPYFTRMSPSDRFKVTAIYEVMQLLGFQRVGVIDGPIYTVGAKDFFLELLQRDWDKGTYPWALLLSRNVQSVPDAVSTADEILVRDSRVNLIVLPEHYGMWLLCRFYQRGMLSPDYVWFVAAFGNWVNDVTAVFAGTPECPCTAEQLSRVAYGLIISGRSPIQSSPLPHGLSGRRLRDISEDYLVQCAQFGNGRGACDTVWTGYFYDGLWHLAAILHAYLTVENHSVADLATESSRQALYDLSLRQDYLGVTGRVRQFNDVDPVTDPPSYGDRDGVNLLRQVTGGTGNEFSDLAYRASDGIQWLADIRWSPTDGTKIVPCSTGSCDMSIAFVPSDRISQCQAGSVFSVQLGCIECESGKYAYAGAEACTPCGVGTFANESGMASCHACDRGSFSNVLGADACELCGRGFYADNTSSTSCTRCPLSTYGPEKGLEVCSDCPAGRSTDFAGAIDVEACQCAGELWEGRCIQCQGNTRYEAGQCLDCQEGLECDGKQSAQLLPGYYSDPSSPFDVYKCLPPEFCPGGDPGECRGGLIGVPCTHCPTGQAWGADECRDCTSLSIAGWFVAAVLAMIGIPACYYFLNTKQTAKATTLLATSCVLAMTISMLQNVGIIGYISFSWPRQLQWLFDLLSIFTLDLQAVGFDCVSHSPVTGYVLIAVALPSAIIWLVLSSLLSRALPSRFAFESAKLISTMGQFMQVSFTIYSKVALSPMMCYSHPNGKLGMLEHNGIFCFSSNEHTPMFVTGLLVLAMMTSFYAMTIWATIKAPSKAAGGNGWFLSATRFLLFRFRADCWWFGTFMLPRGLLLSLAIVLAGDSPYIQMLLIVSTMLLYMIVQLISWPWKLPALNAFDAIISASLILMMAILGAFAPAIAEHTLEQLTSAVIGIVVMLNGIVLIMLGITASALIRLNAMGGSQESCLLALGRVPDPNQLTEKLFVLCNKIEELGTAGLSHVLANLSVYDLRMTQQIVTAVGSEIGEQSLVLTARSQLMSTVSVPSTKEPTPPKQTTRGRLKSLSEEVPPVPKPRSSRGRSLSEEAPASPRRVPGSRRTSDAKGADSDVVGFSV